MQNRICSMLHKRCAMNSRKQHKSICFILILSMLFLGMCFENIEADSSLAYQLVSQADSTLRSSQNTSLSRQIYMEESIGRPVGNSIQLNARRNNSRTGRGTACYLQTFCCRHFHILLLCCHPSTVLHHTALP